MSELVQGTQIRGKVSWFGGPHDPTSGPTMASGKPVSAGGLAFDSTSTLGGWWLVHFPNGRSVVLQQNDVGPASWTGRKFDINYASLAAAGYSEGDFPTGSEVSAEYLGKHKPEGSPVGVSGATEAPGSESGSSTGSSGWPDLTGLMLKAFLYLAFLVGGAAMLWIGTHRTLEPLRESS